MLPLSPWRWLPGCLHLLYALPWCEETLSGTGTYPNGKTSIVNYCSKHTSPCFSIKDAEILLIKHSWTTGILSSSVSWDSLFIVLWNYAVGKNSLGTSTSSLCSFMTDSASDIQWYCCSTQINNNISITGHLEWWIIATGAEPKLISGWHRNTLTCRLFSCLFHVKEQRET